MISPELLPLKTALRSTERPDSTLTWLSRGKARSVLTEFARGTRPLTHQSLDALGRDKTVEHLRAVLVAADALPGDDVHLARLELRLDRTLAAVTDLDDRHVLHRYAVWHHLRRLRARAAATGVSYGQAVHLQSLITAASAFLDLLTRHDLTLATCGQPDLDRWLSRNQVPYRLATGAFVRWATANKLAHLEFPATRWPGPTGPIDADQRWETARRLLHDDILPVATRVAGLLVVLYAQRVTHIARLTVDDVATTGDGSASSSGRCPSHSRTR